MLDSPVEQPEFSALQMKYSKFLSIVIAALAGLAGVAFIGDHEGAD